MRIVVVGAGIAGLSVARALVARGVRPTVVAPDEGFTPAGAGVVSLAFADEELAARSRRSAAILRDAVATHRVGMAQIALTESGAVRLERAADSREGIPDAVRRAFRSEFARRIVRATWSPGDFWVRPDEVLRAFARGVRRVRASVRRIEADAVVTAREVLRADRIVVAAGGWARRFVPALPLELRRAQTVRLAGRLPAMFHAIESGLYARPDGRGVVAGDGDAPWSRPSDRRAATVSRAFVARVGRELRATLASSGPPRPRSAGLVAFARAGRPIAGRRGSIWVVAGLGGDGLALAPAIGEEIARQALDLDPPRFIPSSRNPDERATAACRLRP